MCANRTRNLPAELERVGQGFERWRQSRRSASSRIPSPLWVGAEGGYGVNRTSRAYINQQRTGLTAGQ